MPRIPLQTLILSVPAVVIAFVFHEFAHAAMATAFGDPTPRRSGRLTLEPLAHLDLIGTFCLLFLGFGWAKPTPVQPANFRSRLWGEVLVSAAGVLMNLVLAFLFAIVDVLLRAGVFGHVNIMVVAAVGLVVQMNLVLVVFNLLPIPPLDGWQIIRPFLPSKTRWTLGVTLEHYGPIIMLVLLLFGLIGYLLSPAVSLLTSGTYATAVHLVQLIL